MFNNLHTNEFADRVREICREAGMDFVQLNFTLGCEQDETTPEQVAENILKSHRLIEADRARPYEDRLYDEYLALYKAMQKILQRGHINLRTDDFLNPLAVRITGIGALADCALMTCNLIEKEDRAAAREEARKDWEEHIERTL